ncbi:MAG: DUF11 domain-containing protein [Solirubrobacteraceae bacterium]|nr:DUF11 domain-containing protein [Solirubrobacteraceae bacterium]
MPASLLVRALVAALLFVAALAAAPDANAAGTPNLSLSASSPATLLVGDDIDVDLRASTSGGAVEAYNLSYRVVLPGASSYVAGSATSSTGTAIGDPVQVADQPFAGQTTLLFRNVTDLAGGTNFSLRFKVHPNSSTYGVNTNLGVTADAYANSDPRWTPPFTTAGQHDAAAAHPATSSDVGRTTSTGYRALALYQSATNQPGGKLLRGIHTQQSVVTLSLKTGPTGGVTGTVLDDYLPAGIEYLGCGGAGADHTTSAATNLGNNREYPSAPAITVSTVVGCQTPQSVTTGTYDPPGAQPSGTYTRVRWNIGNVSTGTTMNFPFAVAIPLRSNTLTWTGGTTPSTTTGAQAANLDNNSGAEIADGATLTDAASVSATFGITAVTNQLDTARTAEDLILRKSASAATLTQGASTTWTLTALTSEYRSAADVVVTDTVPDGLCPLDGAANLTQTPNDPSDAECAPATAPSDPYTSAAEQSNGTFLLRWDKTTVPALTELAPNSTRAITYATATRSHYQEGFADAGAVLAGDKVTNAAALAATGRVACGPGPTTSACPSGGPTGNELSHDGGLTTALSENASVTLSANPGSADQQVALSGTNCTTASYVQSIPSYTPGDRICWLSRVDYPAGLDTTATQVRDFLPAGLLLDTSWGTSGDERTGNDSVGASTYDSSAATPGPGGSVSWTLPTANTAGASVFEHRLATKLQLPTAGTDGMLVENLFKASAGTTASDRIALRDTANVQLRMPVLGITERITAVDGSPITAATTRTIRGGEVLTYRLRVTNTGGRDAEQLEAWDKLPTGLTCADIVALSSAGACSGGIVTFGKTPAVGPTVPATTGSVDLTFDLKIPTTIEVGQVLSTASGVRKYQVSTNVGDTYSYFPANNVDSSANAGANVPAVGDTTTITGAAPTITESRVTSLTETGNADIQATIGETVSYTVSATIPAGLTIREMKVTDAIDTRHTYVAGTLQQTAGPAMSLALASGTITLTTGTTWTAPTGTDTTFTFTFDTLVTDSSSNTRGGSSLLNQAVLRWTPPGTANGGTQTTLNGPQMLTGIVEPALTLTKTVDVGSTPIAGGDNVLYTLTLGSSSGTAHESTLVETVSPDITPLNAAGNLIADGESTLSGGVWNLAARTITFSPNATIVTGTPQVFTYRARVNTPVVSGGRLTSTANATTTSLPGVVAAERTASSSYTTGYTASAAVTLNVKTASVTTTSDVTTRTPGEKVLYTIDLTLPANVNYFDVHVRDTIPDAIDLDGYEPVGAANCLSGCTPGNEPTIQTYTPITNGDGTITAAWNLGDVGYEPAQRVIRFQYRAHLRVTHRPGSTNVTRGQTAANSARVMTDRTDKVTAPFNAGALPAPSGGFDDTSTLAARTITVVEPGASIDKTISIAGGSYLNGPSIVKDGQALGYRLTITNTGNSPLYDVTVRDTPDAGLRNVTMASGISTTTQTDGFTAGDPQMTWLVPGPIAAGGTAVIQYTADLPVITSLTDGQNLDNTALVTSAYGVAQATRTADGFLYRSYSTSSDTTRATYDAPTLTFVKTTGASGFPDSSQAEVGVSFPWRMTVTNTSGSETATALTIKDTLPPNWRYVAGTASITGTGGGSVTPTIVSNAAGDQLTFSTALTLTPAQSRVLTYSARPIVEASTTPGTGAGNPHINTAYAGVKNSNGVSGDGSGLFQSAPDTARGILAVPALGVSVTPDAGTGTPASPASFNVRVTNSGAVNMSNVVLSATMPSQITYLPGTATASPTTGFSETAGSGTAATWRIANIAASGVVNITVPMATSPTLATGTNLVLGIDATSDQTVGTTSDDGDITLTRSSDVQAQLSAAPTSVVAGSGLTYTLGARNNGTSAAANVVASMVLPATVTFVSGPAGCVYTSGPRTVVCTFSGDLLPSATVSAAIVTTVDPAATGNANATATAASDDADPAAGNNTASVSVPITQSADLRLSGTASPTNLARNADATITFVMTNDGPSTAAAAQLVATIPAGLTYQSDDGGCTLVGATLTCPAAALAPTATRTVHIVARGITTSTQVTSANASTSTTDPASANNTTSVGVTVAPGADLEMVVTTPSTIAAGGTMTVGLALTNYGPDAATGVTARATLPAGTVFVSADPGCAAAGQVVTCTISGGLANAATATRQVQVQVPTALGDRNLITTGSGNAAEVDPDGSSALSATLVGPSADVSVNVSSQQEATGGEDARVGVDVSNAGPSAATNVVVSVDIAPESRASSTLVISGVEQPPGGNCTISGATATCTFASLAAGQTRRFTLIVSVPSSLIGGKFTSQASASSSTPDPNGANATADRNVAVIAAPPAPTPTPAPAATPAPGVSAPVAPVVTGKPTPTPEPDDDQPAKPHQPPTTLKIGVKSSAKKLRGGKSVTYTITVKNTGKNVATGVKVCSKLPQFMAFSGKSAGFLSGADLCFRAKRLEKGKQMVVKAKARISKRAKKKTVLTGRAFVESDNAKRATAGVAGTVVSDGRVTPDAVKGFTG